MSVKKSLPIRMGDVTKDNFNQLRKLHQVVFPVSYSEAFYSNIQKPDVTAITKLAWHNDVVVGGICCRFEAVAAPASASATETEEKNNNAAASSAEAVAASASAASAVGQPTQRIYIMTLGVLAPYRGRGIGAKLLRQIVEYAESHSSIADVFLHVQINNTEALDFYKKQGFEQVGRIDNYYKKIEPPHCFVLSKKFVHVNMGGRGGTLD